MRLLPGFTYALAKEAGHRNIWSRVAPHRQRFKIAEIKGAQPFTVIACVATKYRTADSPWSWFFVTTAGEFGWIHTREQSTIYERIIQ